MPKPTKKLPKAQVGCVRFNDLIGSMHLTAPGSVVAHETDVVHYATVIPRRNKKQARSLARFFNLTEEERVERIASIIRERNPCVRHSAEDQARTCLKAMES